jgi:putative cell wall-binding protein
MLPKVASAAEVDVVAGEDRYATADAINAQLGTEFENVVLASGYEDAKVDNTVDALTAAPLANALNAPIVILNHKKVTPQDVVNKMKGLGAQNVYIATGVFGDNVVKALEAEGINVVKLGGKDRFETAYKIAKELENVAGTPSAAVIVNGLKKADAISIAPIAAAQGWPIILATQNDVNDTYKGNYEKYYVIGGTGVLSDVVVNEVNGERLAGKDRYSTNAEIINAFKDKLNFDNVYVAKGADNNLIDSLVGAVLAARNGSAIVLVNDRVSEDTANVLATVPAVKNAKYTVFGKAVNKTNIEKDANYISEIAQEEQVTVKGVKAFDDIKVKVGTKVEDLNLPQSVEVELSDGTTTNSMVEWNTTAYDATKAGTYKLEGSLVGYVTDLKAAVNVVVEEEAALKVEEVSANNLKNIVVKFNREVEK